jgi:hypothetical protein
MLRATWKSQRALTGEPAFRQGGMRGQQHLADEESEDGVAEEFELLVVELRGFGRGFGGERTVRQRPDEQVPVAELMEQFRFQSLQVQCVHSSRPGRTTSLRP